MKVATSTQYVSPEKFPPTSDATSFHSHRTYHQVQAWRGSDIASEVWGWKATLIRLVPIITAAPERLLKIIQCNCGGQCDKQTCTCRNNTLQYTPACGKCKGITCLNVLQVDSQDDNDPDVVLNNNTMN